MNDSKNIEIINNFHKNKGALLIHGNPGSGKTYVALELLKNTILVRIDTNNIKNIKDINEHILNILKKRNVTLMFSNKNEQRGLLIDDIHIYHKYDKNNYKSIINFIKNKKYYGSKIIITCNNCLLKNKLLNNTKIQKLEINYNYQEYYRICYSIIKNKNIKLNDDKKDKLIYESKFNFNNMQSSLLVVSKTENTLDKKDIFDDINEITNKFLTKKFSVRDIFRLYDPSESIISLNMLENCYKFIKLQNYRSLIEIYNNFVISDIIETCMICNHYYELKYYNVNLTVLSMNYYINKYFNYSNVVPIYNKYISKSLIYMNSIKFIINNNYNEILYYLLFTYYYSNNENLKLLLNTFNKKFLNLGIKGMKEYYNLEISINW